MFSSNTSQVSSAATYIEDVFSTWLYTGNGSTQTITNRIDLSGKGGMVWNKERSGTFTHCITDTVRGVGNSLDSADTAGNDYSITRISAFNADGFTMGGNSRTNASSQTYVSWAFRKQPKFFQCGTYTGNGASSQTISHLLGAAPGFIIVKRTDATGNWTVWHRSFADTKTYAYLNLANAAVTASGADAMTVTDTTFTVGTNQIFGNGNGWTYVYYVLAHNAGGFGLTGTDNVISCGSFTTDSGGSATVNLGYEPGWVLIKQTDGVDSWYLNDNMRGMAVSGNQPNLSPNSSAAEQAGGYNTYPNATGFTASVGIASKNYIYIAIRRGPMKVPTDGTKVFAITTPAVNSTPRGTVATIGFPTDLIMGRERGVYAGSYWFNDRLRGLPSAATGTTATIRSAETTAETSETANFYNLWNTTAIYGARSENNATDNLFFVRAPGFFDEVCYTGTGSATTFNHNLGVVPEMMIVKVRDTTNNWVVYHKDIGAANYLYLNLTNASAAFAGFWNNTAPTASVFTVGNNAAVNGNLGPYHYVNYLFASCPGVSKVGSYTGTGATQVINCGFTGGARFVLIKATSTTGNWYVWDSARGIVAGNDPYLLLNSTAAEVTTTDWVDTASSGFELSNAAGNLVNSNGVSYIYLAIA